MSYDCVISSHEVVAKAFMEPEAATRSIWSALTSVSANKALRSRRAGRRIERGLCKMIKMLRYERCETLMMIVMSIWLQNLRTVWTIATLCLDRLEVRTVRLSAAKTLQSHNMPKGIDRSMR